MTAHERRLIAALRELLRAYESLLPGLVHIAVQDYRVINEAPIEAQRAIAAAEAKAR